MARDRPSPGPRQRALHPAHLVAPRDRPLLQPARPADHRGQDARREDRRDRPAASTPRRWPTTGCRRGRASRRRAAGDRARAPATSGCYDREFVRRWVELGGVPARRARPSCPCTFERFDARARGAVRRATRREFAEARVRRRRPTTIVEVARRSARAGTALLEPHLAQHRERATCGGWQVARALISCACSPARRHARAAPRPTPGTSSCPSRAQAAAAETSGTSCTVPARVPARALRDELPAAALPARRAAASSTCTSRASTTRCGPTPTAARGSRCSSDESKIGCTSRSRRLERDGVVRRLRAADGPSARAPRPDVARRRTPARGSASASRCCAWRGARRASRSTTTLRGANPGEVWEEDEFWIELSWRIDPDGALGIRKYFESPVPARARRSRMDEYYRWIFEHSVPGLPEAAERKGSTPLAYMRKYGAFQVEDDVYRTHERGPRRDSRARRSTRQRLVAQGGQAVGVEIDGVACAGLPDAVAQARVLLADARRLGLARARACPATSAATSHWRELDRAAGEMRACCRPSACRR